MITYDYTVIDECVSAMARKAEEILRQTNDMRSQVQSAMVEWKGSTADSYNTIANDLANDLQQNHDNLGLLKTALVNAAERMQQQDSSGAKSIQTW
ncbi:WXG100 family type VII secretion target [Lentzea sp. NPDC059081]|uniref:WXG100 family type VII secretion target n=1 Tax=Lentzea sp. NPDC059081 TaxID=3346719 RepID=UPI00369FBD1F